MQSVRDRVLIRNDQKIIRECGELREDQDKCKSLQ